MSTSALHHSEIAAMTEHPAQKRFEIQPKSVLAAAYPNILFAVTGLTAILSSDACAMLQYISGKRTNSHVDSFVQNAADESSKTCQEKLTSFIEDLDVLLDNRETPLEQIRMLLQRYFPLSNCDVDRAVEICSKSKYSLPIGRSRVEVTCMFSNEYENKYGYHVGYHVSFGLLYSSGDSEYPAARRAGPKSF